MKRFFLKISISRKAFYEIEESKKYYNFQRDRLGDEFKNDIKQHIDNIAQFPNLYPNVKDNIKRVLSHRFSFSIFYTVMQDTIVILSVAHQHRKPAV